MPRSGSASFCRCASPLHTIRLAPRVCTPLAPCSPRPASQNALKPLSCTPAHALLPQAQLDVAVAAEDYAVASRLADALRTLQDEDAVGDLMRDLGNAVADERCVRASRRCAEASSTHSSRACCAASPTRLRCATQALAWSGGGTGFTSRPTAALLATRTGAFCVSHPPTGAFWGKCTHRGTWLTCTAAPRSLARATIPFCALPRRWSCLRAAKRPLRRLRAMKHVPL